MLIKSRKRDYYDGVQRFGHDADVMYIRNPTVFWEGDRSAMPEPFSGLVQAVRPPSPSTPLASELVYIGFCGRLYSAYLLYLDSFIKEHFAYRPEHFERALANEDLSRFSGRTAQEQWASERTKGAYNTPLNHVTMRAFVDSGRSVMDIGPETFRQVKAPVWLVRRRAYSQVWEVQANPNLGALGFASMVPPLEAFNLIERYLSTELVDQRSPPVTISDKDQAHKKGFDDRSFRNTSPGPRKARRMAKS